MDGLDRHHDRRLALGIEILQTPEGLELPRKIRRFCTNGQFKRTI